MSGGLTELGVERLGPVPSVVDGASKRNLRPPWQKGVSGNQGGNGKRYQEIRRFFAERSMEAAQGLVGLMQDEDRRIAYMACMAVLERGIGKPRDHSEEDALASRISLEGLDKGERAVLAMLLQKALGPAVQPVAAPEVIEGSVGDADSTADGDATAG